MLHDPGRTGRCEAALKVWSMLMPAGRCHSKRALQVDHVHSCCKDSACDTALAREDAAAKLLLEDVEHAHVS